MSRSSIFQSCIDKLGYTMLFLDGTKITTKNELFSELARVMKFPNYFGHNWDALEECLCDLEWMPARGYIVFFYSPRYFADNSKSDFQFFIEIFLSISKYWADHNVQFLLLLGENRENGLLGTGEP